MKLIEAGWQSYLEQVVPKDAGETQRRETELAFYAGAKHLFDAVLTVLDPGSEPTEQDLRVMESIMVELSTWREAKGFA